ncbi:hypothetical protein EUX48_07415 [Haemophilus haemolyticus]|uniref:Phage protein n=1 Tax=Haemophilus haemolyticus TaxID=726 RepID=A0A502LFN1_HAEHA|nr:hypothetical protein [Haemophilus haemolyticus]TPH21804.1 hypothetical protein EUX48_07415 [Haemophilus haemolyticus]
MTKNEFFKKNEDENGLVAVYLDELEDICADLYERYCAYRNPNIDVETLLDEFEIDDYSEREYVEFFIDDLDRVVLLAQLAKRFIKKRLKSIK